MNNDPEKEREGFLTDRFALKGTGDCCPVCGSRNSLAPFEEVECKYGIFHLACCKNCTALLNAEAFHSSAEQGRKSAEITKMSVEEIEKKVREQGSLAEFAELFLPEEQRGRCLDFGFGLGFSLLRLAQSFREVWGVDLNLRYYEDLRKVYPVPNHVHAVNSLGEAPDELDCIILWHSFEHIPNPRYLLRILRSKLSRNGVILLQVPCFRPDYLCLTHYIFYTLYSLPFVFMRNGFSVKYLSTDRQNAFLTLVAAKS